MKNRAGWLALGVLAIATVLMVFFVLPQIGGSKKEAGTSPAPAQQADTPDAQPSTVPSPTGEAAAAKMQRLTQAAQQSVASLESLFADQKTPAPELYATSRIAAMTALKALSDAELSSGIEAGLADSFTKAKAAAAHALQLLAKLPAAPQDAALYVANIGRAMRGEPEVAINPDTPRFDVLRVEKDGSTVIAGSAAPGAKVEVHDGASSIASATASPNGDFAIVLDKPLAPGDHSLDLKATTKDGKTIGSEEQATVSVPADTSGQVLAMVTKPGEASRLITGPQDGQKDGAKDGTAADQVNGADKQARVAAAQPANQSSAPADASAGTSPALSAADLQITAVELEGDKIFVAGNAQKGRAVTAYADGKQIGSSDVDQKGHFVVEGQMPLSVGQHIISVDLKDANGKVTLRASVPFNRPEGDQVAVVAPESKGAATAPVTPATVDSNLFDRQRDTLAKSFALLSNLYADGKTPTLESLAASRSALEFALKAVADFRPTPSTDPTVSAFMARMASKAGEALDGLKQVPQASVTAMASALPNLKALVDAALEPMPSNVAQAQVLAAQTVTPGDGAAPPTLSQAPLTESKNAVIIRRGDTLWQISRRVYGQGVRYTTIYVANAEQISNPDLIEPGQTFTVPDKSLPDDEAEKIHRKWMLEHKR